MPLLEQVIVLRVAYDDTVDDAPEFWNWAELIDCAPENVGVMLSGTLVPKGTTPGIPLTPVTA